MLQALPGTPALGRKEHRKVTYSDGSVYEGEMLDVNWHGQGRGSPNRLRDGGDELICWGCGEVDL